MTLRHWQASPDYREARAHYRARQAAPGAPAGRDHAPTEPVAAVDGLTIVRKTGTADGGVTVPAQRHW
jgi:hypothetical protein